MENLAKAIKKAQEIVQQALMEYNQGKKNTDGDYAISADITVSSYDGDTYLGRPFVVFRKPQGGMAEVKPALTKPVAKYYEGEIGGVKIVANIVEEV